jgi:tellurite resistance protein TehA-like permease
VSLSPTIRGLAVVVLIAGLVTALRLENTLAALFVVVRIAFVLAIAYTLYVLWRSRREEISTWSRRARAVFYGAAILALVDVALAFAPLDYPSGGLEALVFFAVLAACAFSMWRVWRDEHTYGS